MASKSKEDSDPLKKLQKLLDDEDPLDTINSYLSSPKKLKKKKEKKQRTIVYQRDSKGNRTFPFKGQKRLRPLKRAESAHVIATSDTGDDSAEIPATGIISWDGTFEKTAIDSLTSLNGRFFSHRSARVRKTWKERMESVESVWAYEMDRVVDALKVTYSVSGLCMVCKEKCAIIKCKDCSCQQLCQTCDIAIHTSKVLHNRLTFANGYLQPLSPCEILNENQEIIEAARFVPLWYLDPCNCCGSTELLKTETGVGIVVITLTGKFELCQFKIQCLKCQKSQDPLTLNSVIQSGFWPSTPRYFNCLIHQDVFLLWDQFRKQMPGSSESSFLESLNALTLLNGRSGKIMPSSFSQAFKHWNFARYEIDKIEEKDWMKCPCCSIKQHSCHVDGNCKLYRYKNSGIRRRSNYYKNVFIDEDEKLEKFLLTLGKSSRKTTKENDFQCGGDWTAARNVARKKGSVDCTGLEVATCRHQYGQKAINMKRGEIFGYAFYLLQNFIIPNNVTFVFADVMCKLWKYVTRIDPTVSKKIKGALSVMHAKGHSLDCQVHWDGEWIGGTGRSTGEECEQVFSYLSRCSNTTKYQRPENREETITELILFWNKRKTLNLAETLSKKFQRVTNELSQYQSTLDKQINEMKLSKENIDFDIMLSEIRSLASGGRVVKEKLTRLQALILLKHDLNSPIPPTVPQAIRDIIDDANISNLTFVKIPLLRKKKAEKEAMLTDSWICATDSVELQRAILDLKSKILIPAFQNAIEGCHFEQIHWNTRIRKVADSSKQRFVFRKKLSDSKLKLKTLQVEYAKISENDQSIQFELVNDTNKRALLESHAKLERCKEELQLLRTDMESYLKFYREKSQRLITMLDNLDVFPDTGIGRTIGHANLLRQGLVFSDQQLMKGLKHFCPLLSASVTSHYNLDSDVLFEEPEDNLLDNHLHDNHLHDTEIVPLEVIDENVIKDVGLEIMVGFDQWKCFTDDGSLILPSGFSQSDMNGRNGSNACTVISLLTGYFLSTSGKLKLDTKMTEMVPIFIGCIDIGNSIHEGPELLTVEEAIALVPNVHVELSEERNCFRNGISIVIDEFRLNRSRFAVIISAEKSICVVKSDSLTFLFDSHQHGNMGAFIGWIEGGNLNTFFSNNIAVQSDNDVIYVCLLSIC